MMIDLSGIWVIEVLEFRICFVFRASDFEFTGQAEKQRTQRPICLSLGG